MRKSLIYIIVLFATIFACKRANVTEVKPFGENYLDSTQVLLLKDKYPYMKLVTDKAIHLKVQERATNGSFVVSADEFIKPKVRYLPLETTEECLVGGRMTKLESDDTYIFIFDRDNNQVLRFSQEDGSFMNKFGQPGRGPGEYGCIMDMSLNRKKKEVCLIDQCGFKFIYYDYDGQLLREEPLYYFYNNVEFIGDYMIQYTNRNGNTMAPSVNNNRLVFARQSDQSPKYVGFPFPEQFAHAFGQGMKHPFVTCNEDVYYNHLLSDTIWQIKKDGTCEAKYVFKFPGRDNLFDENDFQNISGELYEQKTNGASCYYRDDICITKDFVYAGIMNGENMLYCIPTGNYRYGALVCKSFGSTKLLYNLFTLNAKSFVTILQPFDVLAQIKKEQKIHSGKDEEKFYAEYLTEEERQLLPKMTPEDNPILMIVDIEPF